MPLRDEVREVLNTLCEGSGVTEDGDTDFQVHLHAEPIWVRVFESLGLVCVFRSVATDVPRSPSVDAFLADTCKELIVFRALWDEGDIILRADLAAAPFCPRQFQRVLDDFGNAAEELAPEAREWSEA
jgi:hypothetical protein